MPVIVPPVPAVGAMDVSPPDATLYMTKPPSTPPTPKVQEVPLTAYPDSDGARTEDSWLKNATRTLPAVAEGIVSELALPDAVCSELTIAMPI
jgi:hypothetical protein